MISMDNHVFSDGEQHTYVRMCNIKCALGNISYRTVYREVRSQTICTTRQSIGKYAC